MYHRGNDKKCCLPVGSPANARGPDRDRPGTSQRPARDRPGSAGRDAFGPFALPGTDGHARADDAKAGGRLTSNPGPPARRLDGQGHLEVGALRTMLRLCLRLALSIGPVFWPCPCASSRRSKIPCASSGAAKSVCPITYQWAGGLRLERFLHAAPGRSLAGLRRALQMSRRRSQPQPVAQGRQQRSSANATPCRRAP